MVKKIFETFPRRVPPGHTAGRAQMSAEKGRFMYIEMPRKQINKDFEMIFGFKRGNMSN